MSVYYEGESFAEAYQQLMDTVYNDPCYVCSPRGQEVRELIAPTIRVMNPIDRFYTTEARSTPMRYVLGELLWYFSKSAEVEDIVQYSKFWRNITNERSDMTGILRQGQVNSNYGLLLHDVNDAVWDVKNKTGGTNKTVTVPITQWEWALRSMVRDPDTRQAIMHVNRPLHQHDWAKDFPCTMSIQMLLREESLHSVVHMRSNDLIFGLTFDFPLFSMFQETFKANLESLTGREYKLGHLTLMAGSSHIYEKDFETVEAMLGEGIKSMGPVVPLDPVPWQANWKNDDPEDHILFYQSNDFRKLVEQFYDGEGPFEYDGEIYRELSAL